MIAPTVFTKSQFKFDDIFQQFHMFKPRVRDVIHSKLQGCKFLQKSSRHYHLTSTASTLQAQFIHQSVAIFVLCHPLSFPLTQVSQFLNKSPQSAESAGSHSHRLPCYLTSEIADEEKKRGRFIFCHSSFILDHTDTYHTSVSPVKSWDTHTEKIILM